MYSASSAYGMINPPVRAIRPFHFSNIARISPIFTGSLRIPSVAPMRYHSSKFAMQSDRKISFSPFGATDGLVIYLRTIHARAVKSDSVITKK